jgi:hypothetical protein
VVISVSSPAYTTAVAACLSVVNLRTVQQGCQGLDVAQSFFTSGCVSDVVAAGVQTDWTMSAVLTLMWQCKAQTGGNQWPEQDLCNTFPSRHFPVWMGRNCNERCVFGRIVSGECVCEVGYWGKACDEICEGGTPVCSGHGECDQTNGQ